MWLEHFERPGRLSCFVWNEVLWRQQLSALSHCVIPAHRIKTVIWIPSVWCLPVEKTLSWRRGYHHSLAQTYPLWYPYHFRAEWLQHSSLGQNPLMETWYRKVHYFSLLTEGACFFGPKPHFLMCNNNQDKFRSHTHTHTQLDCCNEWHLLPKQFYSHSKIANIK